MKKLAILFLATFFVQIGYGMNPLSHFPLVFIQENAEDTTIVAPETKPSDSLLLKKSDDGTIEETNITNQDQLRSLEELLRLIKDCKNKK